MRSLPQAQADVNVAADDGESCHRRKRFHSLLSMQCAFPLKKKTSIFASLVLFYALISLLLQIEQVVPFQSENDGVSAPTDHRHQQQQSKASNGRPLLRDVLSLSNGTIIGSPQFLLDFAIIGFPKCGTTALHEWMGMHPQIRLLENEVFSLMNDAPARLIYRLYTQLPADDNVRRGFKNPLDIRAPHSLAYIKKYFPRTLLIVGIRSSVKWFESLYNFKVQNLPRNVNPSYWGDPNDLIGACMAWNDTNCVGTAKGLFHVHLAALGKILPLSSDLQQRYPQFLKNVPYMPNPIFLYDSEQLTDTNRTRTRQFRDDLLRLLRLLPNGKSGARLSHEQELQNEQLLDSLLPDIIPRTKPDFSHFSRREQRKKDRFKVKICQDRYKPIRHELVKNAQEASLWIRTSGFLSSPDVTVSSPDYFNSLLENWMDDPCQGNNNS